MSVILKFKAGKVDYNEETHKCTPKPLKGEVTIKKVEDDESFYDFSWESREKTAAGVAHNPDEDELLIIPGDVTWKHVKSCTTGRVFCLNFTSGAKSFYWMQDKNDNEDDPSELSAKDKEIAAKIQKLISDDSAAADDDDEDDNDEVMKT
ncbi:proteasome regulatory particle lid subunit [Saccharomycopsis crataegensis]|uniref:Proteasome regulatory particle lid subunit n=1 Tax=Saccharomycopsis crataegensis TaxID=43959 RepID=A0AAV5QP75_9ASCO|nr:proteasome regulatory particle lid subunit [Saccharomycopsis crataegensis]